MKMYNGTIELDFDERKHSYKAGTELFPGVTSVLYMLPKPWLAPWAVKIGAEEATEHFNSLVARDSDDQGPHVLVSEDDWSDIVKRFKGAHRKKKEAAADTAKKAHNWC